MSTSVENPPKPLQNQLIKAWIFAQNPDGTFSPASFGGGGSGGNSNITGINGVAPGLTNPLAVELSDGTNALGTSINPLFVTGGSGSNASVGATGSAVPTSGTYDGINVAGTMRGATGVNPSGSIYAQQIDLASILGVTIVAASAGVQKVGIAGAAGVTLDAVLGAAKPANALQVGGNDGTNVFALPLASGGGSLVVSGTITGITNQVDTNLKQVGGANTSTAASGVQKVGVVGNAGAAFDAPATGTAPANVLYQGDRAATTYPTAATDGQIVAVMADKAGRGVVVANAPRDLIGTAMLNSSSSSAVSFITAGGSGVFNDIISLIITNESSTATIVSLSDNGSGGTVYKFAIAANGGIVINFPTPLPQGTSNAAWDVLNSAAVTCDYIAVFAKNE